MPDESDTMIKLVVFSVAFVLILGLLISGSAGLLNFTSLEDKEMKDKTFSASEFSQIDFWQNDEAAGYPGNVTPDIAASELLSGWIPPTEVMVMLGMDPITTANPLQFSNGAYTGSQNIKLYLLADGWIVYHRGGGWDRWWQYITFQDILNGIEHVEDGGRKSIVHAKVGVGISVVFYFPQQISPTVALNADSSYQVAVGQMPIDATYDVGSVWSIVGQVLTFSLQTTGVWWIDIIASTIVWAGLVIVGFYMINRLLDHIPFT